MSQFHSPALAYRADLDGLRAVAVLAVVAGHAGLPFFHGGFIGVDIFFVLSGYLITSIMARDMEAKQFSIVHFYERRARRILPALFFMLACVAAAGYIAFPPWQYADFARTLAATIGFASNIQMFHATGDYFGSDASLQPLLHTWSLGVEEQFYFALPLLLLLGFRYGRATATTMVALVCLFSFAFAALGVYQNQAEAFFLPQLRAWELGAGSMLALCRLTPIRSRHGASAIGGVGLALILLCLFSYDESMVFPGMAAAPIVLGTVLVIFAGHTPDSAVSRLLEIKPLTWVGKISYSLYLWHWSPIVVINTMTAGNPGWKLTAGALGFALVAAWFSWKFVEAPFRGAAGDVRFSRSRIFRLSAIGITAGLCAALFIVSAHGISSRVPEQAQRAYSEAKPMSEIEKACRAADPLHGAGCRLGRALEGSDKDHHDVAIWGDSHAGAWLPGIDGWLDKNERAGTAYIMSGCPPLVGHVRIGQTSESAKCQAWNADVLEQLQTGPVSTIILSGRWPLNYLGKRFPQEPGTDFEPGYSQGGVELRGSAAMEASLEATLEALRAAGKKVIVIGSLPEFGWSIPERSLDAAFFGFDLKQKVPSRAAMLDRMKPVDELLQREAASHDAIFVPAYPAFCPDLCLTDVEGHLLFRDDDHLSEPGSKIMAPKVLKRIEGEL